MRMQRKCHRLRKWKEMYVVFFPLSSIGKEEKWKKEQNDYIFFFSFILSNKFNYMIKGSLNQSVILNIWPYEIVFLLMTLHPLNYDQFICRAFLFMFHIFFPFFSLLSYLWFSVLSSRVQKASIIIQFREHWTLNIEHPQWLFRVFQ